MDRPAVIPRARRPGSASSLPVDRLVGPLLRTGETGLICITALPGGGKTTAIGFLLTALTTPGHVRYFDADHVNAIHAARTSLAILACEPAHVPRQATAAIELCPWTLDDCMEYLAARHREQAPSVLKRLATDTSLAMLGGSPALLAEVMDRMAANPAIATTRQAVARLIDGLRLPDADRADVVAYCRRSAGIDNTLGPAILEPAGPPDELHWFRHGAVQRIFAVRWIAQTLAAGEVPTCLGEMMNRPLLAELAAEVQLHDRARSTLERLLAKTHRHPAVPMAVSLLLAIDPAWRPRYGRALNLRGAVLRGARWAELDLQHADLTSADCTEADLRRARLDHVQANGITLEGADLNGAILEGASLSFAHLTGATMEGADLSQADLHNATLTGANLQRARLLHACMEGIVIEDARFDQADLSYANLNRLGMGGASWHGATFRNAWLRGCNLEGITANGVDFTGADLTNSLLTGSRLPGACFAGSNLARTGLADIEWEHADLRGADLTHASFHLGSSRSGLVGSVIPGEGSRTGFYTDEFHEQDFKAPEEIRKACLIGADLRGATMASTDFYLVDLRHARYSAEQHAHFVRCGAILQARVT